MGSSGQKVIIFIPHHTIYYDKIYLYAKNLEQDKYNLVTESLNKIADKHGVLLEDILFFFK